MTRRLPDAPSRLAAGARAVRARRHRHPLSALLAALVSPWFLLLTAFVGVNQWLYVAAAPARRRCSQRASSACEPPPTRPPVPTPVPPLCLRLPPYGPIGRLGRWTATHFKTVALDLGAHRPRARRPRAQGRARPVGRRLGGHRLGVGQGPRDRRPRVRRAVLVGADGRRALRRQDRHATRQFKAVVADAQQILAADPRVTDVVAAAARASRSPATATPPSCRPAPAQSSNEMVRAADDLKARLAELPADGVQVSLTGASGMWSDFNEANKTAMMKSELISWPVTLGILLLAFGSLVAAGLPLMLTILGLVASAGSLYLGTQLLDISIWAMNFALMFALALGIDYALFIVYRFRGAFFGSRLSSRGRRGRDDGHRRQGRPVLRPDRADLAERGDARARRPRSARWRSGSCSRSSSSSRPR